MPNGGHQSPTGSAERADYRKLLRTCVGFLFQQETYEFSSLSINLDGIPLHTPGSGMTRILREGYFTSSIVAGFSL